MTDARTRTGAPRPGRSRAGDPDERLRRLQERSMPAPARRRRRSHPAAVARAVVAGLSGTTAFGLMAGFALSQNTPASAVAVPVGTAPATTAPATTARLGATPVARSPLAATPPTTARPAVGRAATSAAAASPSAAAATPRPVARPAPVTVTRGS